MKTKHVFLRFIDVFIILDGILLLYFIFGSAQLLRFRYGDGATVSTILTYLLPTLLMSLPLLILLIVGRYFVKESIMRHEQIRASIEVVESSDAQESDNSSDEEVIQETITSFENSNENELEKEEDIDDSSTRENE